MNDIILSILILTDLGLLGTSRLRQAISLLALQGIMVGVLPLFFGSHRTLIMSILAIVIIILKGGVFPGILLNAIREVKFKREIEPYIGYAVSSIIGMVLLGISFWLGSNLALPVSGAGTGLVIPAAIFTISTGLILIVSRKKAVTLVIGYLVIENGISAFGLALASDVPLLIELGTLLDVFAAVLVMSIIIYHINMEFKTINSEHLSSLKG